MPFLRHVLCIAVEHLKRCPELGVRPHKGIGFGKIVALIKAVPVHLWHMNGTAFSISGGVLCGTSALLPQKKRATSWVALDP